MKEIYQYFINAFLDRKFDYLDTRGNAVIEITRDDERNFELLKPFSFARVSQVENKGFSVELA